MYTNFRPSIFKTQVAGRHISDFLNCVDRINAYNGRLFDDHDAFRCRSSTCQSKDFIYIISRRMSFNVFKAAFDVYIIREQLYDAKKCNFYLPLIVRHGLIEYLRYVYQFLIDFFGQSWMKRKAIKWKLGSIAVLRRHHECFLFLYKYGHVLHKNVVKNAASIGDTRTIRYIYNTRYYETIWDQYTAVSAARKGRLECLKYMIKRGCPISPASLFIAVKRGHFETFIYLTKKTKFNTITPNYINFVSMLLQAAFDRGEVRFIHEILKDVNNNINSWNEKNLILKQCITNINYLVKKSKMKSLKYMRLLEFSLNEYSCYYAADGGSMKMLKYCHQSGAPWSELVPEIATKNKNFKGLKYCHENGCPWNFTVYMWAIVNDDIDCLKYALENNCPMFNLNYKYMLHITFIKQSTNCWDYLLKVSNFDINDVSFSQEEWLNFLHEIDVFNHTRNNN